MQYVRLRIIEKFRGISSTYDHHVLRQDEGYERDCIWNRMRYDRTIKREEKKKCIQTVTQDPNIV